MTKLVLAVIDAMKPAMLERAPQVSFAAGGILTAVAGVVVWAVAGVLARRPVSAEQADCPEFARR